jgi:hypothetical protein
MAVYRVAAMLMWPALTEAQTLPPPQWHPQTAIQDGRRIVFGRDPAVPADKNTGTFDVRFACTAEDVDFEIKYHAIVDNSRKSTQNLIDQSSLTGKLTINFPPNVPFRPKGRDTEERTFQATNLDRAAMYFSDRSKASTLEQLGGVLANRDQFPVGIAETGRIAFSPDPVGTLAELRTASSLHFTMPPGYRYTPALTISPSQVSKDCDGGNEREEIAGSAATFAAKFPAVLQQAARENGLDPRDLADEEKWVLESVRTCAEITPQTAPSLGPASTNWYHIDNPKYTHCVGQTHVSGIVSANWNEKRDWGVDVIFEAPRGGWQSNSPSKVTVTLTQPGRTPREAPYSVLSATIERGP